MKNEAAAGIVLLILVGYLALSREALSWIVSILVIGIPAAICAGLVIHAIFTRARAGLGSN